MPFDSAMAMSRCDHTLLCNFPKCGAKVWAFAWVTACSHVFCDQHGSRELKHCPACFSALSGKLDILRRELEPTKEYKAMVLTGLCPDKVLDITTTALSFWNYQMGQEHMHQERQNQSRELEHATMRREMASLKKEKDEYKRKYSEMSEEMSEMTDNYNKWYSKESERVKDWDRQMKENDEYKTKQERKYQKLAGLYDSLRLEHMALAEAPQQSGHDVFNTGVARKASSPKSSPFFSFLEPEGAKGSSKGSQVFDFTFPSRDRSKPYTKKP